MDWDSSLSCEVLEYAMRMVPRGHRAFVNDSNATAAVSVPGRSGTFQKQLYTKCRAATVPAGLYNVKVYLPNVGYTLSRSSKNRQAGYQSNLRIDRVISLYGSADLDTLNPNGTSCQQPSERCYPAKGGLGGGVDITLRGRGFGLDKSQTTASVCGRKATVTASSYDSMTLRTAEFQTMDLVNQLYFGRTGGPNMTEADRQYFYEDIRQAESLAGQAKPLVFGYPEVVNGSRFWEFQKFFDTDQMDMPDVPGKNGHCWVGFSLPPGYTAILREIKFYPGYYISERESLRNSRFEIANDTESQYQPVYTIPGNNYPPAGWNTISFKNQFWSGRKFRWGHFGTAGNKGCLLREVIFRGFLLPPNSITYSDAVTTPKPVKDCPIVIDGVRHPDANFASLGRASGPLASALEPGDEIRAEEFTLPFVKNRPQPSRVSRGGGGEGMVLVPAVSSPQHPQDYARYAFQIAEGSDLATLTFGVQVFATRTVSSGNGALKMGVLSGQPGSAPNAFKAVDMGSNAVGEYTWHTLTGSLINAQTAGLRVGVNYLDLSAYSIQNPQKLDTGCPMVRKLRITGGGGKVVFLRRQVAVRVAGAADYLRYEQKLSLTPFVEDLDPRNGTARGNTLVTVTGENFDDPPFLQGNRRLEESEEELSEIDSELGGDRDLLSDEENVMFVLPAEEAHLQHTRLSTARFLV